jgi:hypothetical protein
MQNTNLIGTRFGLMEVIGVIPGVRQVLHRRRRRRYIVRCACGENVSRSAKAIKNPRNRFDRCDTCRTRFATVYGYDHFTQAVRLCLNDGDKTAASRLTAGCYQSADWVDMSVEGFEVTV